MASHGWDRVDYLKMDMEGAEAFLLSEDSSTTAWLDRASAINIEVHAPLDLEPFLRVLETSGFDAWKDATHWSAVHAVRRPSAP